MNTSSLATMPVTLLKGVGPKLAELLARRDIYSLQDLLLHLPLRYQDRTRVSVIRELQVADYAVLDARVTHVQASPGVKSTLTCQVSDSTGQLYLRFFNSSPTQKQSFHVGQMIRCFGEVRLGPRGLEIVHPEYRFINETQPVPVEDCLTPIYPTTEGLTQITLRRILDQALIFLERHELWDCSTLLGEINTPSLKEAIAYCHKPPSDTNVKQLLAGTHPMQQRLILEELLAHALTMQHLKRQTKQDKAPSLTTQGTLIPAFLQQLSFALTAAQQRVLAEIFNDLQRTVAMTRLVQGDVGSGKTVVAALTMLLAVENGYQAVLMAPTELLADQHYHSFSHWLAPLGVEVVRLWSSQKSGLRKQQVEAIASHQAQVVIGTHALIQESVQFSKVGVVVIDEQHRFGVHQRHALRYKGMSQDIASHQLIMTATPIPRSLAMTAYGDLDCSVIDELPPGRTPVTTVVIANARREEVIDRVAAACEQQRQAYWVCTLIDESEVLECQAAEATAQQLRQELPHLQIGLVHGRLPAAEKESIMAAFKAGTIHLLVATTVIEVGVDVPNASLMIIENPERLGLAQLHQLRGRVGRGHQASHCVLMYQTPLSSNARARLQIMRESTDGFVIAQRDLELRGPGELLGTRQTGLLEFKLADIARDQALLEKATALSKQITQQAPEMAEALIDRWFGKKVLYHDV